MKIFHVYNDNYFEGLVKNNLITENTGFKIQQCFTVPKHMQFNEYAKVGGKLHSLLKEGNYPFYVDRLAGGIQWQSYNFDKALIHEYADMLGEWFLGFQFHESGSNKRYIDWGVIRRAMGSDGPYDVEELKAKILAKKRTEIMGFPMYSLNIDGPEFYANRRYAQTVEEYIEEMRDMYRRKMADVDGFILPADSGFMAMKMENELGMKNLMPEVGGQMPQTRQQLALTRGIAGYEGKRWGAYMENWFHRMGMGYTLPCYRKNPVDNEWYLTQDVFGDDFTTHGANGGSSRLVQRRIYYFTLLSGGQFFAEEWGLNCSFSDTTDFTLSEYGEVKKEFIHSADELGNMKPVIPMAIVLPKDYEVVELVGKYEDYSVGNHRDTYMGIPLSPEKKAYYGHIQDVIRLIFAPYGERYGNEGHSMTNSRFGDMFDIIFEDAGEEVFKKYDYLIDATAEGNFAKTYKGDNVLLSADLEELAANINAVASKVMPVTVDGLHWIVSNGENGKRYLGIFNNEGNNRDLKLGDVIDHRADRRVKVTFKDKASLNVVKAFDSGVKIEKIDDLNWYVTVPAAELVIFAYK